MVRGRTAIAFVLLALAGCQASPEISVSDKQTLVMESTVLAAGITASEPELAGSDSQATAVSRLFNERDKPITVYYRFYWYDAGGLEIHPLEAPRSVTIPAGSSVMLYGNASYPGVRKVRLHLYL